MIAWDEPGAGESEDVPDEFGLPDYADCLAGMIRAVVDSPTAVVGLSWGTTVILEIYRRHPVVVRSMVLADGYAGWRGSLGAEEANASSRTWLGHVMSAAPIGAHGAAIHAR